MQILFGENLRLARLKAGLTPQELAAKANIRQAHVSQIEGGKLNPMLVTMVTLADAVGKDLRTLLRPPTPPKARRGARMPGPRTSASESRLAGRAGRQHPAQHPVVPDKAMKQGRRRVQPNDHHDDPANGGMDLLDLIRQSMVGGIERRKREQVENAVSTSPGQRHADHHHRRDERIQAPVSRLGDEIQDRAVGKGQTASPGQAPNDPNY